jgi:hypothetical protein
MQIRLVAAAVLTCLCWPQTMPAQTPSSNAATAVQIAAARTANDALMRQYSWTSRTEVIDQGQVKDLRLDLVTYGPDGQLQRNVMNDESAPLPRGFIRRRIAEKERQKVEDYLSGLRAILEQYSLPTAGKMLDFLNQARTSGPDASGQLEMTGNGVITPGDTFSVWTDAKTRQTRKIQVATVFQGDVVNLTATFKTLASGLNHVDFGEVMVSAKQLSLQVQNFNYNKNN